MKQTLCFWHVTEFPLSKIRVSTPTSIAQAEYSGFALTTSSFPNQLLILKPQFHNFKKRQVAQKAH